MFNENACKYLAVLDEKQNDGRAKTVTIGVMEEHCVLPSRSPVGEKKKNVAFARGDVVRMETTFPVDANGYTRFDLTGYVACTNLGPASEFGERLHDAYMVPHGGSQDSYDALSARITLAAAEAQQKEPFQGTLCHRTLEYYDRVKAGEQIPVIDKQDGGMPLSDMPLSSEHDTVTLQSSQAKGFSSVYGVMGQDVLIRDGIRSIFFKKGDVYVTDNDNYTMWNDGQLADFVMDDSHVHDADYDKWAGYVEAAKAEKDDQPVTGNVKGMEMLSRGRETPDVSGGNIDEPSVQPG